MFPFDPVHRCAAALIAALAVAAPVAAQPGPGLPVAIASFNLAWAGTPEDFQRHLQVCGAPKVNWCDTRARWAPGTTTAPPEEVARAQACQAATLDAAGGAEASMRVAPCNAYRGAPGVPSVDASVLRRPEAYAEKLAGLRATVEALLAKEQVRVIAFQEVSSADAVKAVLGRFADRFEVCAAQHNAFQTVAFAWDKSLSDVPGRCATHAALAVLDPPNDPAAYRRVRPGLALELQVSGDAVTFMNVHLKAACASATNSNPRYPARLLTDAVDACEVFNRQVPLLEDWIDAVAARSPRFVLLGDFNRRIDEEIALNIPKDQVRADGTDPASRPALRPDGRTSTRYLWPELADGSRALFLMPLRATDPDCRGFVGLDHIVISGRLQAALARQPAADVGARKVPVVGRAGQPIETSDHCPQVGRLLL